MFLVLLLVPSVSTLGSKIFYDKVVNNPELYDKNFAPFEDGEKLITHVFCYQVVLTSVVENTQSVGYVIEINITWNDPRLEFNESEYGTWKMLMPSNSVWIPRIDIYNAMNNRDIKKDTLDDIVEVRSDGHASQVGYAYVDSACRMDLSAFPFDEQWCPVGFTSSSVALDELELIPHSDLVFTVGLPEWDIVGATAFQFAYLQEGRNYTLAEMVVHIKRKPNFYIYLLIVPTFIITTICISAMLLPIEMQLGERINLGIAGLLSLTFMLSIMLGELPKAPTLPLLGKWVIAEIVMCCISMAVPMILHMAERRFVKFEVRCLYKYLSLACFFLINIANSLTTILLFVCRSISPAPTEYKPL